MLGRMADRNVIIKPEIFSAKDALHWAPWLLGKVLVRRGADGRILRRIITETEAYNGEEDLACHASKGRTTRTLVMYQPGGRWYVYLCYGMHEMLNLVVGRGGFPAAVLIRGLHDVYGPGRLTKQLEIGRSLNGRPANVDSGLYLEDSRPRVAQKWIRTSSRIGVNYAGLLWSKKPWRYTVDPQWPGLNRPIPHGSDGLASQ
jgi:DNA-3-methyladenine glycosylase